jgi:capsular polysaccharide biosynthesis protein
MTEQPLDLKGLVRMLRRRRRIFVAVGVLGLLLGLFRGLDLGAQPSAQALVLLPPASSDGTGEAPRDIKTAIVVATSESVLERAGKAVDPPLDSKTLKKRIDVSSASSDILSIVVRAPKAEDAIKLANAVADEYVTAGSSAGDANVNAALSVLQDREEKLRQQVVDIQTQISAATDRLAVEPATSQEARSDTTLLGSLRNEQSQIAQEVDTAAHQIAELQVQGALARGATRVLQEATTTLPESSTKIPFNAALGLIVGLFIGAIASAFVDRRDPRLRLRSEIADAVGVAVLGSVTSERFKSGERLVSMIEDGRPSVVDSWAFRRVLHELGLDTQMSADLQVMTVEGDTRAVVAAAQLAAVAADSGLQTMLIAESAEPLSQALRVVCVAAGPSKLRPRLTVSDRAPRGGMVAGPGLNVSVIPIAKTGEAPTPGMPGRWRRAILVVTAGFATREQLSRVALVCADGGSPLAGIVLVGADENDHTTGRPPQLVRPMTRHLPPRELTRGHSTRTNSPEHG